MKEDTFKRLLSLIEKTGDRLVITDPAGEHPYVLMGLEHYEKLVVGEWKPEVQRRESAPPQTLPISTGFPDNKPPKREIPLWKSTPTPPPPAPRLDQNRPQVELKTAPPTPPPVQPLRPSGTSPLEKGRTDEFPSLLKRGQGELSTPPIPEITAPEPEGEEQFYLEPLE